MKRDLSLKIYIKINYLLFDNMYRVCLYIRSLGLLSSFDCKNKNISKIYFIKNKLSTIFDCEL